MTEEQFIQEYLVENIHTKHIPTYLRDYPKFTKLMLGFSNYIKKMSSVIEFIISKLNLSQATGDILEKLAQRLDIYIEKPVDDNGNVIQELYEQQLKIAILGNGLKRTSNATRNALEQLLQIFKTITRMEITDFGIESKINPAYMTVAISVRGTNETWTSDILEEYVFPNITGVGPTVNYLLDNQLYFGFDENYTIIGEINEHTANVSNSLLDARVIELNNYPAIGQALIDSDGNCWCCYSIQNGSDNLWQNKGQITTDLELINPGQGYAIQGWDKGNWSKLNVIN